MGTPSVNCNLCETRHAKKIAEAWCSICQKGFCNKCRYTHISSRKNRGHKFISVEKHHKLSASGSTICMDHENKSHYFCKEHDEIVCVVCYPEVHNKCQGFTTLHEASKSLKLPQIAADIDRGIKTIAGNIQQAMATRNKTLTSLKEQKKKIEEEINVIRNSVNDKLTKIQEELLHDLTTTYQKQTHDIGECLKTLDAGKKEMQHLKEQLKEFSQSSSSIPNFMKTLQVRKRFKNEEKSVMDAIKVSKPVSLILKQSSELKSFYDEGFTFGTIEVQNKTLNTIRKQNELLPKTRNGPKAKAKSLTTVVVQFQNNIKNSSGNQSYIKSCSFKSDGQMVFTEPENKMVVIYDKKSSFVTSISLSGYPFDIASINYCTLALTFERQSTIQIIDLTYSKVSKSIHTKNLCRGIAHMNGQLFVVVKGEGILVMDTFGQIKKTLPINVADVRYLSASNSRLCFTDQSSKTVHCCDLRGKEIWHFQDKSIEIPLGVTLDSIGNAYVIGSIEDDTVSEASYNVVVISPDGTGSKVVLKRPGRPSGIDFDKKYKRLVLYNLDGAADLYGVTWL